MNRQMNESARMKSTDLDSQTEEGIKTDETDSLFTMMDDIEADFEVESHNLSNSVLTEETASDFGKSVKLQGYPELKTLAEDLPKSHLLKRLLDYPEFRRQVIYRVVNAFKSRIRFAFENKIGKTDYISVRSQGYSKSHLLKRLLDYPEFRRQVIYRVVNAFKSRRRGYHREG